MDKDVMHSIVMEIQAGHEEKMEELYLNCRYLISNIAYRLCSNNDYDDLCQEGYLGLYNAAKLWKPNGGASFIGYASRAISRSMIRYKQNNESDIKVPTYIYTKIWKYKAIMASYIKENGKEPSAEYLIDIMQISSRELNEIKRALELLQNIISLNQIIKDNEGNEDLSLEDIIPDKDDQIEAVNERIELTGLQSVLWKIVDNLSSRQAESIRMKYQKGKTLQEIGDELGITVEAVSASIRRGLNTIRQTQKEILQPYIDDYIDQYALKGNSVRRYKEENESSTERAAIKLDRLYRDLESIRENAL